jgi:hypothetical protein
MTELVRIRINPAADGRRSSPELQEAEVEVREAEAEVREAEKRKRINGLGQQRAAATSGASARPAATLSSLSFMILRLGIRRLLWLLN